ncbi:MAG: FecR domain-containing protein [Ferruginibacter sp.]
MPDYTSYKTEDLLLDDSFLLYCKGNPAEIVRWKALLAEHPEILPEINRAKELYQLLTITLPQEEKLAASDKLKLAITSGTQEKEIKVLPASIRNIAPAQSKWIIKLIAAAAIIAFIVSVGLWFNRHSNKYDTPVADFAKASFKEIIQAKEDPRKEVQLPDGSVAILNYGSILKIADEYDKSTRWVYLEGEAFFSVKPDAEKPFVVITDKTATSALGTSFKVRNYPGEESGNVMLATGKVKVQAINNEAEPSDTRLLPGQQATFQKDHSVTSATFKTEILTDWRSMKIVFNKAKLDDIVQTLEFYYGIQVKLQNKPATEIAFTGKFFEKSLKEVLEAISFTNKFRYTQTGNTVSILFQ